MHRPGLNLKLWQLIDCKDEPRAHDVLSALHSAVSREVGSAKSVEQLQKDSDLVLVISLDMGFVPSSLTNEMMPCRHRGHAIEPGGPWFTVAVLLVEHR